MTASNLDGLSGMTVTGTFTGGQWSDLAAAVKFFNDNQSPPGLLIALEEVLLEPSSHGFEVKG